MKVLLVDDDRALLELLAFALNRAGLDTLLAYDVETAVRLLDERPQLAVLDVNLGRDSGFDLLRRIRQRSTMPVLMLSGRDAEDDKVRGLELGADDYVTKPFSHRELLARIRAGLRRADQEWSPPAPTARTLRAGAIELDLAEHTATNDGVPVELTVTEFRLLRYLMTNAGAVVPTRVLLRQVWGYDDPVGTDVVRVAVHRLRRKLEQDPADPALIQTVAGVGVILKTKPL